MEWEYFQPTFEYESLSRDQNRFWAGHRFFAYDLVTNTKPEKIVELGTHYGTSFFSFCQAVKDNNLNAKLFAVDTWKGDEHAGFYDEEVFESVQKIKNNLYGSLDITLARMSFDEAKLDFLDNSIDLIHIDGLHTYEAVRHDFETWLPKLKADGIMLFHDTSNKDYEAIKLWNELKKDFDTIEFEHAGGLGVLFNDSEKYLDMKVFEQVWRKYYKVLAEKYDLSQKLNNNKQDLLVANRKIEKMRSSKLWRLREKIFKLKEKKYAES